MNKKELNLLKKKHAGLICLAEFDKKGRLIYSILKTENNNLKVVNEHKIPINQKSFYKELQIVCGFND